MDAVALQQADVILAAAKRLWPRCQRLKVFQHEDGRWLVCDQESHLWWEARPGGAGRDLAGYRRPDTVAFIRVTWASRTPEDLAAAEVRGGVPEHEMGDAWL